MLDVIVTLARDGVIVNKNGESSAGKETSGTTAVLGVAVLGQMKLGET